MSRVTALPYRLPRADRIQPGPWLIGPAGKLVEDPDSLEHWDYATAVWIERELEIDIKGMQRDCGLESDAELVTGIRWHSTWTGLRGTIGLRKVAPTVKINAALKGELLGGSLTVEAFIGLGAEHKGGGLAPRRVGSVIWKDQTRVALEGRSARFPMQVIDFERAGILAGSQAAWMLMWAPDRLEVPVLGVVRLLLNSRHPVIQKLVADGPTTPELRAVQSAMSHDLRRQMILGTLFNSEFDRYADYGEDSLGTVLQGILDISYGDQTLDGIRGLLEKQTGEFESDLQAKSALFWPDRTT